MLFGTTLKLLKAFETCPRCNQELFSDKLVIDVKTFSMGCDCGWGLAGTEIDIRAGATINETNS